MKKKYIIVSIYIITIILISLLVMLLSNTKKEEPVTTTTTIVETTTTEEPTTTVTTTEVTTTSTITTKNNTTTKSTTTSTTTQQIAYTPKKYTCPNNYELQGDKCITVVAAEEICPKGYWPYVDNTCIDPNDDSMVINQGDTCPNGTGALAESHLDGTPTIYYCKKTTAKKWGCEDGFTYNNSNKTCTKTINATLQ